MPADLNDHTLAGLQDMLENVPGTSHSKKPTFLEISGTASSEYAFSNILSFFINPTNGHELGDLCLKSLLECCNSYNVPFSNYDNLQTKREQNTKTGRLDLVVWTDAWVIAIENKIWHILNNNLEEYSSFVDEHFSRHKSLKIVLSIRDEPNLKGNFSNVTYIEWVKNIKQRLYTATVPNNTAYYIYFTEFIKTIEKLYIPVTMEAAEIQFLINNQERIKSLHALEKRMWQFISQRTKEICSRLNVPPHIAKNIYAEYDIVLTYKHGSDGFKLECFIEPEGIRTCICVDPGNRVEMPLLAKLDLFKNNKQESFTIANERVNIGELLPFQTSDNVIVNRLTDLINQLNITSP